jgi:hypothetical protein
MTIGEDTSRYAFPQREAELDEETIERFGLREPLTKLANELIQQLAPFQVVGIKIDGITFTQILARTVRQP